MNYDQELINKSNEPTESNVLSYSFMCLRDALSTLCKHKNKSIQNDAKSALHYLMKVAGPEMLDEALKTVAFKKLMRVVAGNKNER